MPACPPPGTGAWPRRPASFSAFIDSDDTWEPTFLAETVGHFDAEPDLGLAYSWYDVIDAEGRRNGRVIVSDWEGDVWEQFLTRNPVACSGAVVPKKVFESVGGFSVNRDRFPVDVEDWELWIRIAADHRVAVVSEPLVHHRRHDSNSTSNVESLDAAYRNMLEVVFDGVDGARLELRPMATTARAEILLGWHSLIDRRDGPRALAYRWLRPPDTAAGREVDGVLAPGCGGVGAVRPSVKVCSRWPDHSTEWSAASSWRFPSAGSSGSEAGSRPDSSSPLDSCPSPDRSSGRVAGRGTGAGYIFGILPVDRPCQHQT